MIRIAVIVSSLSLVLGCADAYVNDDRNKEILKAMKEGRSLSPSVTLKVYDIPHGVQQDDSYYINSNNLLFVERMISCPKVTVRENSQSYRAKATIDRYDMTVKVNVNREGCTFDSESIKAFLDKSIADNKQRAFESAERERKAREVDPRGPYKLGCEAYKQHVKGSSDVTRISTAIKLYPKLNSTYVKNLFIAGWNDASVYGVRGVDCDYLSFNIRN